MYRILKANKDGYVTNKIIKSGRVNLSSSVDSNVGQAGTIDLFKLYNETPMEVGTSGIELSRGVIQFDIDSLRRLTGSLINYSDSSFKAYVRLKNVYGGQTVPSNYTLVINPLAKSFDEGRGNDVIGYRDLDVVNWLTASINGATITTWSSGGINASGSREQVNVDYYTSFLSSTGYVPLTFSQSFGRGDEDLFIDITPAVSATLAGILPDYGYRIAYTGSQETDGTTRFVKRFSSRQSQNTNLHPALVIKYDDSFFDNQVQTWFDYANKIGLYFAPYGVATNFVSSSTVITGSGSLLLTLSASASQYVSATTYSFSHNATITYQSASWAYFSASFTGSQRQDGGINQTGSYYADVVIPLNSLGLSNVMQTSKTLFFRPVWTSLDKTVVFSETEDIPMSVLMGSNTAVNPKNYGINITNLLDNYINTDVARLRVFVYDFDTTLTSFYLPYKATPKVFKNMHWRLIDPYTKEVIIPFDETDNGTKMSADGEGMYFDLYMSDLPLNRQLEIEMLIKENNGGLFIENQRFMFKVVVA